LTLVLAYDGRNPVTGGIDVLPPPFNLSNVKENDMNFAQITISGNIGAEPEVRDVNGTKVAGFSVAVNEGYTNKQGEKVEKTHWYRCEAWDGSNGKGLVTNVIEPYAKQGTTVFVQGFPIIEEYEKDGIKQRAFKVKLAGAGSTFRLASKSEGGGKSSAPDGNTKPNGDDDIPF